MPSRRPSASGPPEAAPSPAALFAALPSSFQTAAVDFAAGPFARLTYAYPARPPARLDLAVLPEPMRQEVGYWLHTLAVAGERVNSWVLAGRVRVAVAVAAGGGVSSFTALSVEEWVAAGRRRYHDRHHRLPPPSSLHNHRATIARLHERVPGLPEGWSPHWLRHTHASALLLAGVPLHVVSRRLGHADVQTTMDLYGWVTEDAELRAVAGWRSFTEGWRVTGA